jgi:periplasmic protein TonB
LLRKSKRLPVERIFAKPYGNKRRFRLICKSHTMTSQQILQADLLDILFEKRNKAYGAYQLRKAYQQQLLKAVAISITTVFLLLFFFQPSFNKNAVVAGKDEVLVRVVKLPDKVIKKTNSPTPPETLKAPVRQQKFTGQIQIKKIVTDPLPPIDAMEKVAISTVTTPGGDVSTVQPLPVPETKAAQTSSAATQSTEEVMPDKQPQFPGGMQAWLSFLSRNLQAPESLEGGEKRIVIVRFYVAEDGSIANFQVEKSAGTAFDGEVIRVLKKMPKWSPAMKAGKPVSVSFTQPVTFVGMEE